MILTLSRIAPVSTVKPKKAPRGHRPLPSSFTVCAPIPLILGIWGAIARCRLWTIYLYPTGGEGKSTLGAHLRHCYHQHGAAGSDRGCRFMRRPSQHILFSLSNRQGLSHYLSEPSTTLSDVLQTVPGNPRLQVLTAGQQPPAPGGLLSSNRMRQLIDQCRKHYDMVIIDTPSPDEHHGRQDCLYQYRWHIARGRHGEYSQGRHCQHSV